MRRGFFFGREQQRRNAANHNNNDGNSSLKVLLERRCSSSLSLNDDDESNGVVCENKRLVVRKYSYVKLPQQLLKLTVLKLDGSSFDVQIGRNATVAELKQAVEEIFASAAEDDQDNISWSHVWGHFCLSYENQKLINDKICIRNFGIRDGDQLQFVRHMSINHSNSRRSQIQTVARKPLTLCAESHEEKEEKTVDHTDMNENEDNSSNNYCEGQEEIPIPAFKLAHFLRGWLSYSRRWGTVPTPKRESQGQKRPSRFALRCLGGRSRMIELTAIQ